MTTAWLDCRRDELSQVASDTGGMLMNARNLIPNLNDTTYTLV